MVDVLLLLGVLIAGRGASPAVPVVEWQPCEAVSHAASAAGPAVAIVSKRGKSLRTNRGCLGRLCLACRTVTGSAALPSFHGTSLGQLLLIYPATTLQTSRIRLQV
jgi:hypothetical protein